MGGHVYVNDFKKFPVMGGHVYVNDFLLKLKSKKHLVHFVAFNISIINVNDFKYSQ